MKPLPLVLVTLAFATQLIAEESNSWPELPEENGRYEIPAQEWPARPGARKVRVLVHFPRGKLANVNERTGIMLTLHNWGGEDCVGTAAPQELADRLNVVALCVNYLQSGAKDSIEGPEPYDFGYLQALDALRALWHAREELRAKKIEFDDTRIYATGGSGGGNVALMCNKLAPRTFACIVDLCGMKKLSDDIAFNLPGGSDLDARWSRDPKNASYLSPDEQQLRFLGSPEHLQVAKKLGASATIAVVHGVDDTTCLFADAREFVENLKAAGHTIEPHFIRREDLDGTIFTSTGHSLGNRTKIVFKVAEDLLAVDGKRASRRKGMTDFDLRDELVRYPTANGAFVVSYRDGYPVGRFEKR